MAPDRRTILKSAPVIASLPFFGRSAAENVQEVSINETESLIHLQNEHLKLSIRRDNGGIHQLLDRRTGVELRETSQPWVASMWGLQINQTDSPKLFTNSFRARLSSVSIHEANQERRLKIRWEEPSLISVEEGDTGRQLDATIHVEVSLGTGDKHAEWELEIQNRSDLAINVASCPEITNISPIDDSGEDAVVLPRRMGRRFPNPTDLDYTLNIRYPSGFGCMQFTAYTGPNGGFYADAPDPMAYAKELVWRPNQDPDTSRLVFSADHYAPQLPGGDVQIPYPIRFGVHRGTWYDAAKRYRDWATNQGPLENSEPDPPDWLLDKGVSYMVKSYTRFDRPQEDVEFEQVLDWTLGMRDELDASVQLDWRGWAKHGFPAGGDWLPPKEGVSAFEQTIQELRDAAIETVVFINITNILTTSDYWRENQSAASEWLIRDQSGDPETYTGAQGNTFYKVETTQEGWQRYLREIFTEIIESGAKEIHLDGFPWIFVPDCFEADHSHPSGRGGAWYQKRAKTDLREIKSMGRGEVSDFVLSGEGIADFYLPEMQVHNIRDIEAEMHDPNVNQGEAEVIPLLRAALGDYYITRGELNMPPGTVFDQREMLRFWIGRSLTTGMLLRFQFPAPLDSPNLDKVILAYIGRVARARETYANRFLARGRLLPEPVFDSESVTLEARGGKWSTTTSEVQASAWEADSGAIGVIFTNVSKHSSERTFTIDIEAQPFQGFPGQRLVYKVKNGEYAVIPQSESDTVLDISLKQGDILLLVVDENTESRRNSLEAIVEAQSAVDTEECQEKLEAAKRAFEADSLELAQQRAEEVTHTSQTPASSGTETSQSTTSNGPRPTTTTPNSPRPTTTTPNSPRPATTTPNSTGTANETTTPQQGKTSNAKGPGFGLLSGVVGTVGGIYYWLRRSGQNSSKGDEK